jgi:hypothetical protein
MSEGEPPQTADNAVRAFILLFVLGFVLRGVDEMDHSMSDAIQKWAIAGFLAILDFLYVPIRQLFGPRFTKTAALVATDFRWWTVSVLVVLAWSTVFPIWSRSLEITATPMATTTPTAFDHPSTPDVDLSVDLKILRNEELRTSAYVLASEIQNLAYFCVRNGGEFDAKPASEKARLQLQLDQDCNRQFRTRFVGDLARLQEELDRRLNTQTPTSHAIPDRILNPGYFDGEARSLIELARRLP